MNDDVTAPADAAAEADRRAARNAAKLAAVVAQRWDVQSQDTPRALGTGAAMAAGDRAFVLIDDAVTPGRAHGLGAALAWARRAGAGEVHVIADGDAAGTIARHGELFTTPISIWRTHQRDLEPVAPAPIPERQGPPDAPELVAALEAEGLDVVVEGDRLSGEFRGLEVVRIVRALDDGEPILEVGVGRFDRELTAMMHGELPDPSAVARVVEQLEIIRRPQGPPNHPLGQLVPERWLRWVLLGNPELIGCDRLVAAPTPEPRDRLRERGIAAAVGRQGDRDVVVACSVGVDLEAVVLAADARAALDPDATLVVVVPERDRLPSTSALVAELVTPGQVMTVANDWRR